MKRLLVLLVALLGLGVEDAYSQAILAELHLDETAESTTYLDSSGNSHTGSCTSCPLNGQVGAIGNAPLFTGASSQYIAVTFTTGMKPTATVGLRAYVKASSAPANGGEVASMGDSYALRVLQNGNVRWLVYNGGGIYSFIDTSGVNVLNNAFHKLEGRKTAVGLELYIDDVLQASNATTAPIDYTLGTDFNIGRHANGDTTRYFTGIIDHVIVYDPGLPGPGGGTFPGGFTENQGGTPRVKLTTAQINGFIPATRGAFAFPPPYNTRGYRITIPADCPGNTDCVNYIGYPYWMRMNAHTNDSFIYILVGLSVLRGGPGLTLYKLEKSTGLVTKHGNLFPSSTPNQTFTGETYYFSFNQPYTLYFDNQNSTIRAYNIQTQAFTTVVDIFNRSYTNSNGTLTSFNCTAISCQRRLEQSHVNGNDTVFAGTLIDTNSFGSLGCWVYMATPNIFRFYPKLSTFDECTIDKTGQYTIILENVGTPNDEGNRIFDNNTGLLITTKTGPSGTLGHMDCGYSYCFGVDNNGSTPPAPPNFNATTLYQLPAATPNTMIHFNNNTTLEAVLYPTHNNARPTTEIPFANQFFCGSRADSTASANEVTCANVNGAITPLRQLIVAPIMTDINAAGGNWQSPSDDYDVQPKGNLDVTGHYFLWTSNMRGNRLDAFVVEVPSQLLGDVSAPSPPTGLTVQ